MKKLFLTCALLSVATAMLAGPFENLGFDAANTDNPVQVYTNDNHLVALCWPADVVPSWRIDPLSPQELVGVNQFPEFGYGYATLFTDNKDYPAEDRFSLDLFAAGNIWTLTQTGDIPSGTKLINFLSYDAHYELSLNGTVIPLTYTLLSSIPAFGGLPGYLKEINDVYGDISQFAGTTVALSLKTLTNPTNAIEPDAGLDSIQFITFPSALTVNKFGKRIVVSWPASNTNFVLQTTDALLSTNNWQNVPSVPALVSGYQIMSTNITGGAAFYRLMAPP
jgi:hypothetical protein